MVVPSAVTVTVNVVLARASVGVPEMVPVFQSKTNPEGNDGDIAKVGTAARPLPEPWIVVCLSW